MRSPPDQRRNRSWDAMQRDYWDRVASSYERLYHDSWSDLENRAVVARLRAHLPRHTRTVLDLGCGAGLGEALLDEALGRPPEYHGLDISPVMLASCRRSLPAARLSQGTMTDLSQFNSESFDAVTAFFATGSYAESLDRLIHGATRVLKRGGMMYLSFLGRWALRRIVRLQLGPLEAYHTRHEADVAPPLVLLYSRTVLSRAFASLRNLRLCALDGEGSLAAVVEAPRLWPLSAVLDNHFPALAHLQEVIATKIEQT